MTLNNVNLTASENANLLALASTNTVLGTEETQLSTGKSVNSALDNATAYFASQGFLNTANSLSTVASNLSTSLQAVQSASNSISSVSSVVAELQGITTSALGTTSQTQLTAYATQYNALLVQLNQLVNDSTFNGTNLLNGTASSNNLTVYFNASDTTSLTISGVNLLAAGLSLSNATASFSTTASINTAALALQTALNTLTADSAQFGNNATLIQTRQSFTNNLVNALQTASNNLVLADTNVLGADVTTLQTQQSLGVVGLSIAAASQKTILNLI